MASGRLPSLKGIEAFIAAARASSFRDAAEQLHLTTSAISRRIQSLEEQIGVLLFERNTRSVRLTAAGQDYLQLLMPGLEAIHNATRTIQHGPQENYVRVACSSMITSQWLNPTLAGFREQWPDVSIEVYALDPLQLSAMTVTDLAIATINDGQASAGAVRLFGMTYFPICSAELQDAVPIREPADLYGVPLIESGAARDAWPMWFRAAGLTGFPSKGTIMIEDTGAYIEAVIQGLGVGLGSEELTGESLRRGSIRRLFDVTCRYPRGVYLRRSEKAMARPSVRALHDWLVQAAGPVVH